jgi:hypothetical protein
MRNRLRQPCGAAPVRRGGHRQSRRTALGSGAEVKRRWLAAAAVNLGAALLAVLAFGIWKRADLVDQGNDQTRMEGSITAGGFYDQGMEDVGFITRANRHVTARKLAGSRVLYDVSYTTGPHGFRVVPGASQARRCVLLFGDSLTFGEGVDDGETTAAQVVARSKGMVAALSLGIGGWGPHQFLAGLQSGRFQRAVTCQPTEAIYLFIPAHTGRAAGRGRWDQHGPLFYLNASGHLVRAGNFNTASTSWRALIGLNRLTEEQEEDLSAALIGEAARELQRLYPGLRFHVFTWDGTTAGMLRRLSDRGLRVHTIRQLIPDYSDAYLIAPPIEAHPNPRAYEQLADYVLELRPEAERRR